MSSQSASNEIGASSEQLLQQAVNFHRQGLLPEAERIYSSILERWPRHFEALYFLGMLRTQQGRPSDALPLFEAADTCRPGSLEALAGRAAALSLLECWTEALDAYNRLLGVRPADVDALHNRGVVLAGLGRDQEALQSFDQALAISPNLSHTRLRRGNVLAKLERFNEPLVYMTHCWPLLPATPMP